ncbi:vimentin-type intermediate filament-associated coiled-coil protein-like [Saccoglossus kowalevskii]|uniref:Vimentin-type intermediate filament-associated coiled-coil protein-like n=1 Tax=Saccoglossus kowalevskii TaxID=10224 RepID=A0ABM0N1A6_SACKO|nr:PREDICTED: vimentin-type intermediate filament-associated coiled-coil protein-like [Saccoglossus kowalevskii]
MFSPSRSTIREANDHLQALYTKVNELEHTIKEQAESMINKDVQMQNKLKEVASGKNKEINELRRTLESSEAHMQRMLATNREKDALIAHLQQRCQVLDELCLSKPILEKLVAAMTKAESLKSDDGEVDPSEDGGLS